jgi:hypothetical protein
MYYTHGYREKNTDLCGYTVSIAQICHGGLMYPGRVAKLHYEVVNHYIYCVLYKARGNGQFE